ncbi:MAG: ATP-binding protein, partial [Mycobacteriales bacterium]
IADSDDAAESLARLRRAVARLEHPAYAGVVPSALEERLSALLGLEESEHPPWDGATPGPSQRGRERAGVVSLFTALAADGPLLLVVDDAHLARPALLEAIAAVAADLTGRVLLVAAGRPELLEVSGDWWMTLPDPQLLPLVPLEEGAAERLLRAYLAGSELDPEVRTLVLDRAQGNPFFLAELLHLLVDRGVLHRTAGGWVFEGELPADVLPAGVHAVLAARIDTLDPTAKAVLRDAAILGARFPVAALGPLGHPDPARLAAALTDLEARGMIRQDGAGYYRFGHTLARDAAYAGMPKADRARRHAVAARWAATAMGGPADGVDTVVASQTEHAVTLATEMSLPSGDRAWSTRGLGFAAAARLGQAALDRDDHRSAEEQFDRALRLGGSGAPRDLVIPARLAHAEALAGLRRLGEAEAELAGARAGPAPGLRAGALVVLGDIRRKRGDENGARAAFVSALAAASDAGLDRVTGEAIRQLGLLDYFTGRLRAAENRFREALELARRVGDQRGAGWALQHLAWSATTRADYALAEEALADAAAVFTALSDTGGLSWCAGTEAFIRVLQGRLTDARSLAAGLLVVAESTGQGWEVAACLTIDALAAAELGMLSVAGRAAADASARFAQAADTWGQSLAMAASGVASRGLADLEAAAGSLHQAVRMAEEGGHTVVAALALVFLGLVQLEAGDVDGAAASAARVEQTLAGLDLEPAALVGPRVLGARVLLARGQVDEALAMLRSVAALPAGPDLLYPRRQALAHLAETLLCAGEPDEALAAAREAVGVPAEDVRSRVVALRVLADVLVARGEQPAARAALEEAWQVATSTEQVSERSALERGLAALG